MTHIGCKHLDYDETKYDLDIKLIKSPEGWKWWERGKTWTETPDGQPDNPSRVQMCKLKGRIKGIFQCINPGEMGCFEAQEPQE